MDMRDEKKHLLVFGYGLGAILFFVSGKIWLDHGYIALAHGLLNATALLLILCSVFDYGKLRPVYRIWMKGARGVGFVISNTVLVLMFYLVFAPVGIALRLLKKDILDRSFDAEAESYWIQRGDMPFVKEHYLRQF